MTGHSLSTRVWDSVFKICRRAAAAACALLLYTVPATAAPDDSTSGTGSVPASEGVSASEGADDLCLWTAVNVRGSVGEHWILGGRAEVRMHDGMGTLNQAFLRTSALYRIGNHLRVGTQVDFAKRSSGFSLRYIPEISLHWASGVFRFMLRQWYMATHTPPSATAGSAAGTGSAAGDGAAASGSGMWAWSSTMRTKFQTIWQLPDSRFSLRAAIEPFY